MSLHGKKQSGAVLVISLVMLSLVTIIGITAAQTSSLEEKMVGNLRDQNIAFQAAESALLAGERFVAISKPAPKGNCKNGVYKVDDVDCDSAKDFDAPVWLDSAVWAIDGMSKEYNVDNNNSTLDLVNLNANPRYIIERMKNTNCPGKALNATPKCSNYRITAVGKAGSSGAAAMLQSMFIRLD